MDDVVVTRSCSQVEEDLFVLPLPKLPGPPTYYHVIDFTQRRLYSTVHIILYTVQ